MAVIPTQKSTTLNKRVDITAPGPILYSLGNLRSVLVEVDPEGT